MPDGGHADRHRPDSLAAGLAEVGIHLGRPPKGLRSLNPGTYTLECPRCGNSRHGRKTPSLHLKIDPDGQGAVWSCFNGAGKRGSACEWNAPQGFRCAGAPGRSDGRAPERQYRRPPTDHVRAPEDGVYEWFAARGISRETVDACGVRSARVWMPQTQREERVIAFPFKRGDAVINWKYRGPNKIFRQEKDAEKILFGLNDIAGQPVIYLVEGEPDKMALWEAGIRAAASLPDGGIQRLRDGDADPDDPKFTWIANCEDVLLPPEEGGPRKIILALDMDEVGRATEAELGRRLGMDRCYRVRWPEGCKDANDTLMKHGAEAVHVALERAQPFPIEGIVTVDDMAAEVLDAWERGLPPGIPFGFDAVDFPDGAIDEPLASLRAGEVTVITGAPGSGKSELWDQVMLNTARCVNWSQRQKDEEGGGWRWAILGLETPVKRHIISLAMKLLKRPFRHGAQNRMTREDLENALAWLNERFIFLHSDAEAPTVGWIKKMVPTAVRRFAIKGFLVDPYTEVVKDRSTGSRDTDLAEEFLATMRMLARVHAIHGSVIAHPAKPGRDAPKVPGLYDISGSAHWANKADLGISVYRDRESPGMPVEMHVKKVRFREIGHLGVARLEYVPEYQGYRDERTPTA